MGPALTAVTAGKLETEYMLQFLLIKELKQLYEYFLCLSLILLKMKADLAVKLALLAVVPNNDPFQNNS